MKARFGGPSSRDTAGYGAVDRLDIRRWPVGDAGGDRSPPPGVGSPRSRRDAGV